MRHGWTLDRASWEAFNTLATTALRSQWRAVRLDARDQDSVPSDPGIYAILATPAKLFPMLPAALTNTVYVGKASALQGRFLDHCGRRVSPDVAAANACFGYRLQFWFVRADGSDIAVLESLLIECLGPSANRVSGAILATVDPGEPA